MASTIVI